MHQSIMNSAYNPRLTCRMIWSPKSPAVSSSPALRFLFVRLSSLSSLSRVPGVGSNAFARPGPIAAEKDGAQDTGPRSQHCIDVRE